MQPTPWKISKERNERIDGLRKQELELKKQALQQEERKNENMMKLN